MRHHLATVASGLLTVVLASTAWAWSHTVVLTVGAFCVALVAIVTAVRTIAGLRPVRWLWRQLVGRPVDEALEHRIVAALDKWWNAEGGPSERLSAVERRFTEESPAP